MRKNNVKGVNKAGTVSLEDVVAYIRSCGVVGDKDAGKIADAVAAKLAETAGCPGCTTTVQGGRVYVAKADTVLAGSGVRFNNACTAGDYSGYATLPSILASDADGVAVKSNYYHKVLANGEVFCPYTDRRFLPAQYLRMMAIYKDNVDAAIAECYDLKRVWKTLRYELIGLDWMRTHWRAAYDERSVFFPLDDVRGMVQTYLEKLREDICDMSKCHYSKRSGRYTRRIPGYGIVVLWNKSTTEVSSPVSNGHTKTTVETVTMTPFLAKIKAGIESCLKKLPDCESYSAIAGIIAAMPKLSLWTYSAGHHSMRNWQPVAWRLAFKKAGAYYTLKSLVRDGIVKFSSDDTGTVPSVAGGLTALKRIIHEEAYVVHAILKRSMAEAGTNAAKIVNKVTRK